MCQFNYKVISYNNRLQQQSLCFNPNQMTNRKREEKLPTMPLVIEIDCEPFTDSMVKAEKARKEMDKLKHIDPYLLECLKLNNSLEEHEFGYFFKWPVNPYTLGLPNYWQIIRKPMDLWTIRHKIITPLYSKPSEFDKDIRLMFNNALLYNHGNQEIIAKIKQMVLYYEQKYDEMRNKFDKELLIKESGEEQLDQNKREMLRIQQFNRNFFTEDRRRELGKRLSRIGTRGRAQIRRELNKRYPGINLGENISLKSLDGMQLLYLIELANKYEEESYGCTEDNTKVATSTPRKRQSQEQSSFEIEQS